MKPLALLAAVGAVAILAACSQTSRTSATQTSPAKQTSPANVTRPPALVNCPQLYDNWKNGAAKKTIAAVNAVASAISANDISAEIAAVKKAAPAVDTAASHPIPACADPKGYWDALLLHVNAAVGSVKSATGRASIMVALKGVPQLEHELSAEVKRTAQVR